MFVSSSCLENCVAMKAAPPQGMTLICSSLNMHQEIGYDTALAKMLKANSVFSFVPRLTFRNETNG